MKVLRLYSLKTKFMLISALIVALFSVLWGSRIAQEERVHLEQQLVDNGQVLLTSLRAPVINTMILAEMGITPGLLDNYVEEIVKNRAYPTVYAFITDEKGQVLAHSQPREFGKIYRDPLTRGVLTEDGFKSAQVSDGRHRIMDLGLPLRVSDKSWGSLRIGLSMQPIEQEYLKIKTQIALFSLLVFLGGMAVFYLVGRAMARPLEQLAWAMGNIDLGAFQAKPLPPRRDEIGLLQESFAAMLLRLRRSEQERENALNSVIQNEKMATIGKIVAGVAHEINNPLAAISTWIHNVERSFPADPKLRLESLRTGIQRIQTIVQQLKDFSRVGSLELSQVPSDLFFQEVEGFAGMALGRELIAVDECRPPVLLQIDKGKMHQVLLNLLVNASAAAPEAGRVELRAAAGDGFYCMSVLDHGPGIPEAEQERIFDIFYTTKPAGAGSGIGLAICKSIVDLHRGRIELESAPGRTVFRVLVPLERGEADAGT